MAAQQAVLHVVFDLQQIAALGELALRSVERMLETSGMLRDQQRLELARLVDIDRLVRRETASRPMRSILRQVA